MTPAPADLDSKLRAFQSRSLDDAYRLAAIALGTPVEAMDVVLGAFTSAWDGSRDCSQSELDAALRREIDSATADSIRRAAPDVDPRDATPLELTIAALSAESQVELVRRFGLWADGKSGPDETAPGATTDETAPAALWTLAARIGTEEGTVVVADDVAARLKALYESRDPGTPAPMPLRIRLQAERDRAAEEQAQVAENLARSRRRSGWGFGVNAFLALAVLTLAIALASVVDVRASAVASADPTGDPASPLTIAGVSIVQLGIDGPTVHVGATQRTLIASFAASPLWHASDRECLADVVGTINWDGSASWVGPRSGHVDTLAGDPSSASAYVAGPGPYCQLGQYTSTDGGTTWSSGALPGDGASDPTWLAFDPSRPGRLLAYSAGTLWTSADAGAKWESRQSLVVPLAFDSKGRLVGWTSGKLLQSLDDGTSWEETGPGPADQPATAGATAGGTLVGTRDGLWWYPLTSAARQIESGSVFAIATLGDDAVVLGADSAGHPWLGTVGSAGSGVSLATLPSQVTALTVSGGGVAINDSGAVAALSGTNSAIVLVSFAY